MTLFQAPGSLAYCVTLITEENYRHVIREQTDVNSWLKLFRKFVGVSASSCPAVSTDKFEQQTPSRALGRTKVGLQVIIKPVSPPGTLSELSSANLLPPGRKPLLSPQNSSKSNLDPLLPHYLRTCNNKDDFPDVPCSFTLQDAIRLGNGRHHGINKRR